jgi:hypothetical protein
MFTTADMLALAAEIERAERGSKALDIKIELMLVEPLPQRLGRWLGLEFGVLAGARYTRSLDGASSLVPPGERWQIGTAPLPRAEVGAARAAARSPALALAAAAIRAHAGAAASPAEPQLALAIGT